jgi:hypothetical protein
VFFYPVAVAVADVDGKNGPDLVVVSDVLAADLPDPNIDPVIGHAHTVWWGDVTALSNDGAGNFTTRRDYLLPYRVFGVTVAPVTSHPWDDLIVATSHPVTDPLYQSGTDILILPGKGDGTFDDGAGRIDLAQLLPGPGGALAASTFLDDVQVAYLAGAGGPPSLVAADGDVLVVTGDGHGSFSAVTHVSTGRASRPGPWRSPTPRQQPARPADGR